MISVKGSNGFIYEDYHPKCKIRFSSMSLGNISYICVAFIQCFDGTTGDIKRYWGYFDDDDVEGSIIRIMQKGSKWPDLPAMD